MVSNDRGQVLLVGAVVLAVTLIGIVVLLNGVAYTEHVGGGTQASFDEAEKTEKSLNRDLQSMAELRLLDTDTESTDIDTTTDQFGDHYTNMLSTSHAAAVDVTYSEADSRTVIEHGSGSFVPDNGDPDPANSWDVVDSAEASEVESFEMEIDQSTIPSSPTKFVVRIDTWEMRIWAVGSGEFQINGPGGGCSGPYSPTGDIEIDFVSGDVTDDTGVVCSFSSPPISDPPSTDHTIAFESRGGPSNIFPEGSYEVVLRGTPDMHNRPEYDPTDGPTDWPEVRHTLRFDFAYETPSMTYESTIDVEVDDT